MNNEIACIAVAVAAARHFSVCLEDSDLENCFRDPLAGSAPLRAALRDAMAEDKEAILAGARDFANQVVQNSIENKEPVADAELASELDYKIEEAKEQAEDDDCVLAERRARRDLVHIISKARDALHGGFNVLSTGEKLAAALVLNRADWLASMDYTMAEAIDRVGAEWLSLIPEVARMLRDERDGQ
jgi:hypothetical protein